MNRLLSFWAITMGLLTSTTSLVSAEERPAVVQNVFEPPVRLLADGEEIDTGPSWGHSSPCVADLDGDGLDDLILGDFSGKFHVYRNVGSATEPAYKDDGMLQAGGVDAKVWIYCCIGSQARMGDLNGDGILDIISNSYDPGHCYLFLGLPDHQFAAQKELLDKAGVPVRAAPKQQQDSQSFGSFYELVDWENDGDLDLLIGCFNGDLKLRINEGTKTQPEFAEQNSDVQTRTGPLKVAGHLCPVVADWDDDGVWDIIAGSEDGSVTYFRNVGDVTTPEFAAGQVLVPPHEGSGYNIANWDAGTLVPGIRSQVDVTDFNGDGQLDLLLGDFYTALHFKQDISAEVKADIEKRLEHFNAVVKAYLEKRDALQARLTERFPGDALYSDEASQMWQQEYEALGEGVEAQQMASAEKKAAAALRPYLSSTRGDGDALYDLSQAHGYVWVYVRKSHGGDEPVAVKFESSRQTVRPGDSVHITVNVRIAPGYEIHALEVMPRATATRLELDLPHGFSDAKSWEEPPQMPSSTPGRGPAYHGNVTFYKEIPVAEDIEPGDYELTCSLAYQACNAKQCLRPVELTRKIAVSVKP
ncbi:FG-GAP repeat domain-containing protein [Allorhodopirellula heiligendammensis]|uniref:FG-GAP repeat protein n=1 Tax=Allorhodopirellula heiligendammensis TaxID=2714739 RepID=A0A5C6BF36_9BACT|nr:VCBS repeat-containing protein [Allorhodopirellula heiligendammensis]TWU10648.1 FG-GAP repeat protein [Allorhodopirellula heiligendammensis]